MLSAPLFVRCGICVGVWLCLVWYVFVLYHLRYNLLRNLSFEKGMNVCGRRLSTILCLF